MTWLPCAELAGHVPHSAADAAALELPGPLRTLVLQVPAPAAVHLPPDARLHPGVGCVSTDPRSNQPVTSFGGTHAAASTLR